MNATAEIQATKPFSVGQYAVENHLNHEALGNFLLGFLQAEYRKPFTEQSGTAFYQAMSKVSISTHKDLLKLTGSLFSSSRSAHLSLFARANEIVNNTRPVTHAYDQINAVINFDFLFVAHLIQHLKNLDDNGWLDKEFDLERQANLVSNIKQELVLAMGHAYQIYQQHIEGQVDLSEFKLQLEHLYKEQNPFELFYSSIKTKLHHPNAKQYLLKFYNRKETKIAYHGFSGAMAQRAIEELFFTL